MTAGNGSGVDPHPVSEANRPCASSSPPQTAGLLARLAWLTPLVLVLIGVRCFGPQIVEEIQYAAERGRLRAELDTAKLRLGQLRLKDLSKAYQLVSQRVGPAVVHIRVSGAGRNQRNEALTVDPSHDRWTEGQGSGVVVDAAGYILTNEHVVHDCGGIEVSLSDGRIVPAEIVGEDELTDLAVLKVEAGALAAAEWGDSQGLRVGELVWAVGSPYGLEHSITFGILSAKNRAGKAGTRYQDFLQTDAAVNPGNSGGPLVDADARLVGINTAILGESYQGISFAIPSHVARQVFERIRLEGRVARGWLGVEPVEVTPALAQQLGLSNSQGAYVLRMVDGPSPARQAGMQPGDVVLRWNGEVIGNHVDLYSLVGMTKIGSTVEAVIHRGGRELVLKVAVSERPPERPPDRPLERRR